jgi:hypothetical protein
MAKGGFRGAPMGGVNMNMIKQAQKMQQDMIKMQEEMPDSSVYFLDRQALAMDDFVQFYIKKLVQYNEMPQALQQEMTKMFMEASKDHPLFKDKDKEMVLAYYNSGEALLRFSLDTDWEKAFAYIQKKMEKNE